MCDLLPLPHTLLLLPFVTKGVTEEEACLINVCLLRGGRLPGLLPRTFVFSKTQPIL